ncbi:MAG TPA: SDR family oxidoreductase [Flavisolibacter sp.]
MRKVLITGANGFVGFYLTRLLLQESFEVIATGRGACRLPFTGPCFFYESLDFTNEEQVSSLFNKYQPGVVVHAGAISKPDECEANRENAFLSNVSGTMHLLRNSAPFHSHFIFMSTDFVFDGEKGMYGEDDERKPVNFYGETKMMAEDEVMKYDGPWTIVRTVLVYGKPFSGRDNIVSTVAGRLSKGESVKIFTDQVRTPTYVEDLAAAITRIIVLKKTGIFHISGADVRTPYQMAVETAHLLGYDPGLVIPVTEAEMKQPARRPPRTGFVLDKATKELDFHPTSFAEGLKKTLAD